MAYSKEFLLNLYKMMLKIRLCEESFVEPINNGIIKTPCHLYSGEEAIATGLCAFLKETDYVFGNHRSHGHFLAKGGSLNELVAEVYCKETGCSRGRGGSMHLIDTKVGFLGSAPIVAGTISLALGSALASKIKGNKNVTVSFFGDGATGEGVLQESMNYAALQKLPIIFACENNYYSTHMPIKEIRISEKIYTIAKPLGIETYIVDGNDILAVCDIAKKSIDNCRKGNGPVFIEFKTYRQRGHVGPDDNIQGAHTDIRPKKEIEKWLKKDPIKKFEKYLIKNKIIKNEWFEKINIDIKKKVENAHKFANESLYPSKEGLLNYVYK